VILATILDVAVCSALTSGVVVVLVVARVVGLGRDA